MFINQFCSNFACRQLIDNLERLVTWPLQSKAKQRPQWPLKVTLVFVDQFCSNFACRQLIGDQEQLVTWPLQSKAKQRPQQPLKVTLVFMDRFCSNFACRQLIDDPERLVTWPLQSKAKQRPQRPLKVTLVFMDQNWCRGSLLLKNQNWSTNAKVTFKGRCGLRLAFDCKGHVTSRSGLSKSYLHAKFE